MSLAAELDDLKSLLTPRQSKRAAANRSPGPFTASRHASLATSGGLGALSPRSPGSTFPAGDMATTVPRSLKKAEGVVASLSRSLSLADREMEDAVRQARELHRQALAQKDQEIDELRRALAVKDRAVDTARESTASRVTTLEARVRDLEAQLADSAAESRQLRDLVGQARQDQAAAEARADSERQQLDAERASWEARLEAERATWQARVDAERDRAQREAAQAEELRVRLARAQAAEQQASRKAQVAAEEHTRAAAAARSRESEWQSTMDDNRKMREELAEARSLVAQAREALRLEEYKRRQAVSKLHAERKGRLKASEVDEIKQRLLGERRARKALEQWLQSELKSREEMEVLFTALRDVALTKPQLSAEVAELIRLLRKYEDRLGGMHAQGAAEPGHVAASSMLDRDSRALREEISKLRAVLQEKLAL